MKKIIFFMVLFFLNALSFGQVDDLKRSYDLGILAFNSSRFDDAKTILENVVSQTNQYPIAFYVLGKIYRKPPYEDKEKARLMFEKAYLNSGSNTQYKKYSLVMLSYTTDDVDVALSKALEAYGLDKNDPDVTFAYAMALNKKGMSLIKDPDKALPFIKKSTEIRRDIYQSKNNLAFCYIELVDVGKLSKDTYCPEIKKLLDYVGSVVKPYPAFNENLDRYKKICSD